MYLVILMVISLLVACKKYPENRLWLKKPEKLNPFNGTHLRSYKVNGIDSLDLLNSYYGHLPGLEKDIRTAKFETLKFYSHSDYFIRFTGSMIHEFTWNLIHDNNSIVIRMFPDSQIYSKNLFVTKETEWDIIRLSRKGPFKIKTKLDNGNTYEIEIE